MPGSSAEQPVNVGSLADTNIDELIDRARRSDDWREQLDRLIEEAGQLIMADPVAALQAAERLVALSDEMGEDAFRSRARRALVQALAAADRNEEALAAGEQAIELADNAPIDAARARMALIQVLDKLGRL